MNTEQAYTRAKRILSSRFGDALLVSHAYRKKIDEWPKISANDGTSLRRFSDFLEHCCTAMGQIKYLNVLDDLEENQKILKKLPVILLTDRAGWLISQRVANMPKIWIKRMMSEAVTQAVTGQLLGTQTSKPFIVF